MISLSTASRFLITIGVLLVFIGIALHFLPRISWFGNLPGDVRIENENFTFYFPITTCLILSFILTLFFKILG